VPAGNPWDGNVLGFRSGLVVLPFRCSALSAGGAHSLSSGVGQDGSHHSVCSVSSFIIYPSFRKIKHREEFILRKNKFREYTQNPRFFGTTDDAEHQMNEKIVSFRKKTH
jgi:hypothetical protein